MTNPIFNRSFLMETQDSIVGGFSKWPQNTPGMYIKVLDLELNTIALLKTIGMRCDCSELCDFV